MSSYFILRASLRADWPVRNCFPYKYLETFLQKPMRNVDVETIEFEENVDWGISSIRNLLGDREECMPSILGSWLKT